MIPVRTAAQRRRWARMAKAGQLRAAGWSLRDIGAFLGVSPSTILEDLRRLETLKVVEKAFDSHPKSNAKSNAKSNVIDFRRNETA
jgi:IS30 family transposase